MYVICDLGTINCNPLVFVAHDIKKSCFGGAVVLNICDAEMQCCHQIALGVEISTMADGFSLDTIFLRDE